MKILSITPTYFPEVGGIESVVRELAVRISGGGSQVDIAHVSAKHAGFSVSELDGIKVYRVPVTGQPPGRLCARARPAGRRLRPAARARPATDDAHRQRAASMPRHPGRAEHARRLSPHGQARAIKWLHERLLMRSLLRHYRKILASSESDKAYFSRFSNRVEKCENGIAYRQVPGRPPRRHAGPDEMDLLGPLVAQQAHRRGHRHRRHGEGPRHRDRPADRRARLRQARRIAAGTDRRAPARRLGAGCIPTSKTRPCCAELQQRTVFITGSEYEGFGIGILEAMAAGKIVLCRDMAPINGFVEPSVRRLLPRFRHRRQGPGRGARGRGPRRRALRGDVDGRAAAGQALRLGVVAETFAEHYAQGARGRAASALRQSSRPPAPQTSRPANRPAPRARWRAATRPSGTAASPRRSTARRSRAGRTGRPTAPAGTSRLDHRAHQQQHRKVDEEQRVRDAPQPQQRLRRAAATAAGSSPSRSLHHGDAAAP